VSRIVWQWRGWFPLSCRRYCRQHVHPGHCDQWSEHACTDCGYTQHVTSVEASRSAAGYWHQWSVRMKRPEMPWPLSSMVGARDWRGNWSKGQQIPDSYYFSLHDVESSDDKCSLLLLRTVGYAHSRVRARTAARKMCLLFRDDADLSVPMTTNPRCS
jgi:hypothetical protein